MDLGSGLALSYIKFNLVMFEMKRNDRILKSS